jgi:hypothetical protein
MFCEKEGFNPLWKAVNLANRHDLMIVSTKGVSVTAARKLIDIICGDYDLPLFVLHDFDVAGFQILATLWRDTRRYRFSSAVEVVDLGLRLEDITGLEREPAARTKMNAAALRQQLADNGATGAEIAILVNQRVELNAMPSDALVAMIKRKLADYGLKKAMPDDETLAKAYCAFRRSERLREKFKDVEKEFDAEAEEVKVPADLQSQVEALLAKHSDLLWVDAIQVVLDERQLDRVRKDKEKAKRKAGDFSGEDDEEEGGGEGEEDEDEEDEGDDS